MGEGRGGGGGMRNGLLVLIFKNGMRTKLVAFFPKILFTLQSVSLMLTTSAKFT